MKGGIGQSGSKPQLNIGYKGYTYWINTRIFFLLKKARDFSLNIHEKEFYSSSIK